MKTKRTSFLSLAIAVVSASLITTGCISKSNALVPKSVLRVREPGGKTVDLELPKDMKADSIKVSRDTNGVSSFTIKKIKVQTNPVVVDSAGVAQVNALKEVRGLFNDALQAAERAAASKALGK